MFILNAALYRSLVVCCIGLFAFSCSAEKADQAEQSTGEAENVERSTDPCEILSDDFITGFFDVEADSLSRTPSKYSPHPLCSVSWRKPNADEIEKQNEENMMAYMKARMRGEDVKRPRSTNEVSLTINKSRHADKESAARAFDSAMRIMREGMTVEVDGEEHTSPTYEMEPVEDVADNAFWASKLNQLSVHSGRSIFHVSVIIGSEEQNLAKTKEVARALTEILN